LMLFQSPAVFCHKAATMKGIILSSKAAAGRGQARRQSPPAWSPRGPYRRWRLAPPTAPPRSASACRARYCGRRSLLRAPRAYHPRSRPALWRPSGCRVTRPNRYIVLSIAVRRKLLILVQRTTAPALDTESGRAPRPRALQRASILLPQYVQTAPARSIPWSVWRLLPSVGSREAPAWLYSRPSSGVSAACHVTSQLSRVAGQY
jgi:hypothetical protein